MLKIGGEKFLAVCAHGRTERQELGARDQEPGAGRTDGRLIRLILLVAQQWALISARGWHEGG